jgi:archaellum component FlaD/FlaE
MLVGPRRPQARLARDLEDRVHAQVLVRIDRLAGRRIDRQLRRIEELARVGGQLQDRVGQPREALAGIQRRHVLVRRL